MDVLRQRSLTTGAVWLTGLAAAGVSLWVWFLHDPAAGLRARLPGGDGAPEGARTHEQATNLSGTFQQLDGIPAELPGAWPQFRGPDGNNIRPEGPPLADAWEPDGPPVLWTLALGEGYASPAVLGGRVYMLDYDETDKADAIRCFSLDDGREIWRRSYTVSVKRNHGMSRTVPAVTDRYVVTLGPRCHVVCLDAASGDFRWGLDLVREYGTKEPLWYAGQCPIIEDGRAILAPCGPDVLMMAVDCETGSVVWKTPNPKGWDMSHSSITPATIVGKKMYVYCAVGGVTGVSAEAEDAGQILWQLPWNARVIAPSPVPLDQDRVCLTAGYGEGGMMIQVRESDGTFSAEVLHKYGPKDGLSCEQHTPIWHDGLLYSIMPKDAGALRSQFVCYNPEGQLVWSSGQNNRFGLGPFVLADGKFYLLSDDGLLTMVRASRDGYEPLQQAQVLHGQEAWGPIAVAGDRMLMRDSKQLACLHVGANREAR
jgi:outer membrane protein assembly factor BamB